MSRYIAPHKTKPSMTVHYGFDKMLPAYFAMEFDEESPDPYPVSDVEGKNATAEILTNYEVPRDHFNKLILDLPF